MHGKDYIFLLSMLVVIILPVVLLILERLDANLIELMRKNRGCVVFRCETFMLIGRYICFFSTIALLFYYIFYCQSDGLYFVGIFIFFALFCLVGFICYLITRSYKVCFLAECLIDRRLFKKSTKILYANIKNMSKTKKELILKDKYKKNLLTYRFGFKNVEKILKERYGIKYEK